MNQHSKTERKDVEKDQHQCCDHDHDHHEHHHHDHSHDYYENSLDAALNWNSPKVGRNDPCVCGSGKKYKKCCIG